MLETLPSIPIFQDLDSAQTALLKLYFEQFTCSIGIKIFEQGESAVFLYLLIKGRVAIQYKPYDGPSITLTHLHGGDAFGWSAVIGSPQYTSSIVSQSDIEAVRIRGNDFRTLIREHPEIGKVLMDRLASVVSVRWENAHAQVQSLLNSNQTE